MVNLTIRDRLLLVSLGFSVALATGCDSPQPTSGSPSTGPVEVLEKDLKPPVIIKPNLPQPTVTKPTGAERNPS